MSAHRFIIVRNCKRFAPFTSTQLRQLAAQGKLRKDDLVCYDGSSRERQAGSIPGLFGREKRTGSSKKAAPATVRCTTCGSALRAILKQGKPTGSRICPTCAIVPGICPECDAQLGTKASEQCFQCGASWRDVRARQPEEEPEPAEESDGSEVSSIVSVPQKAGGSVG